MNDAVRMCGYIQCTLRFSVKIKIITLVMPRSYANSKKTNLMLTARSKAPPQISESYIHSHKSKQISSTVVFYQAVFTLGD